MSKTELTATTYIQIQPSEDQTSKERGSRTVYKYNSILCSAVPTSTFPTSFGFSSNHVKTRNSLRTFFLAMFMYLLLRD